MLAGDGEAEGEAGPLGAQRGEAAPGRGATFQGLSHWWKLKDSGQARYLKHQGDRRESGFSSTDDGREGMEGREVWAELQGRAQGQAPAQELNLICRRAGVLREGAGQW